MVEIWKDIVGYEGKYQVSNMGQVKSLRRKSWNGKVFIINRERILKYRIAKSDKRSKYAGVSLSDGFSNLKTFQVHTLVWDHFSNKKRDGHKLIPDHINENKLDNRFENLQLLTARQNLTKSFLKKKNKSSKYVGVSLDKKSLRWRAHIMINGINRQIGSFKTEEEAHEAYQNNLQKVAV